MKDLLTEKKNGLKFLKARAHVVPHRVAINSRGNYANKMIISSNLFKKHSLSPKLLLQISCAS